MLTAEEKRELLSLARKTLEDYLSRHEVPAIEPVHPALQRAGGAFVTLEKDGELRGCIGHMTADRPLGLTVQQMAVQAATGDPRFPAVTLDELTHIEIEISALSPMEALSQDRLGDIEIGKHGMIVTRGRQRGVLLPQVAEREGWDRETFLCATCRKAGLPMDSWRKPGTEIEVFTADVFSEKDFSK